MPVSEGETERLRLVHGEFIGMELDATECDQLAIQHVQREAFFKKEPKLFLTKWFDYLDLHPTKATYLYAREFVAAYQNQMQVRLDVTRGKYMRPMKGGKDVFTIAKMHINGLWKGRQAADALGIPYAIYCNAIMSHAEETNWRNLPTPSQMYAPKLREVAQQAWHEERERKTVFPDDPRFHDLGEDLGGVRERLRKHLVDSVWRRERPEFLLRHLLEEGWLSRESAEDSFGNELVERCLPKRFV